MAKTKIITRDDLTAAFHVWRTDPTTEFYDFLLKEYDIDHLVPLIDWEMMGDGYVMAALRLAIDKSLQIVDDAPDHGNLPGIEPQTEFEKDLDSVLNDIRSLLVEKNRKYGDAVLNPKRVFSRADIMEQINVRIDDKISRIMNRQDDDAEDAETDLLGYLLIKNVAKLRKNRLTD